jgi:hypothetical protein
VANVIDWNGWERRLAELWAAFDTVDSETFIARIEARVERHWPAVKRLYIRPQQDAAQIGAEIAARQR